MSRIGRWAITAVLLFAGCADPVADAEARFRIVEKHGSPSDVCEAAQDLAKAYLNAKREGDYARESLQADIQCQNVRLRRNLGDVVE